jgi:hypothetical protein
MDIENSSLNACMTLKKKDNKNKDNKNRLGGSLFKL